MASSIILLLSNLQLKLKLEEKNNKKTSLLSTPIGNGFLQEE